MVDVRTVWQSGAGWTFQTRSLDLAVFTVGIDLPLWKVLTISPGGEFLGAPPVCGGAFFILVLIYTGQAFTVLLVQISPNST